MAGDFSLAKRGFSKAKKASMEGKPGIESPGYLYIAC
jgi:hypothetical protein